VANEDHIDAQEAAAQALMGAIDITGTLPVSVSSTWHAGYGIVMPSLGRLGFALPESVGLNGDTLNKINELVADMIAKKAAPGCQILVAKDGKIVFQKSYGYHDYVKDQPVYDSDLYDLASLTKVLATTISLMKLQDQKKFRLSDPIKQYIPEEDTTNKADLIYEDILAHMGGLIPWIPFYVSTLEGEKKPLPSAKYYRSAPETGFAIPVAPHLYLRNDYRDTIWRKIFSSPLRENNDYRYSDLAFYIANRTIKNITGMEVDAYAEINFYRPMGLRRTLFNPLRVYDQGQITPSEHDEYWRMTDIDGTVHDMGSAMLGGVSGHAGLFSDALEVGALMQMLLNKGTYGGHQYIDPKTVNYYTQRHWRSTRRGIGFDMKELDPDKSMNMSEKASRHTFGHLGFTGTAAFADPDYDIVFVFLSNRTYPSMDNNILGKENYRPKIQSVIYDALMQ
jgi:CubicO group peptidase (beta-lactamase class C family)